MPRYRLIDTYPAFRRWWRVARSQPVREQVDSWRREYLGPWPELFQKQADAYAEDQVDWRSVAVRRVFPRLAERLGRIPKVRQRLLAALPRSVARVEDALGLDLPVTFVLHVGLGCGAGWATAWDGRPAVLLGLESAAELGWTDAGSATALLVHELAHLAHGRRRGPRSRPAPGARDRSWESLYTEGFATRVELVLAAPELRRARSPKLRWAAACAARQPRLARRFLRAADAGGPTRAFFGSWYRVEGLAEAGYYLGSEVVRRWEAQADWRAIAGWPDGLVRRRARPILRALAAEAPQPPRAGPGRSSVGR